MDTGDGRRLRPAWRRLGFVAFAILTVLLGTATAASAHAALLSTSPSQSAHYPAGSPPNTVVVTFDDEVTTTPKSIGVYDGSGHPLTVVPVLTADEKLVEAKLPKLKQGSYVVVWHIVSDDGHPETGAFTFSVGAATTATADVKSLLAGESSGTGIGIGFGALRTVEFFTCLVLVGGLLFARTRWPNVLTNRSVRRMLLGVAGVGFIAALASISLQAAYSSGGGASTLVDGSALRRVIDARFGTAALIRAGLIAVLAAFVVVAARQGRKTARVAVDVVVALLGLGIFATFAYAGHGDTGRWQPFGLILDLTHLSAAALWLGGLVLIAWALRKRTGAGDAAHALRRFSRLALPAVAVIVISGTLQGWRQIGTWSGLWHTSYGRLLIIKVLVVLAIVVIASAGRDALRERRPSGQPEPRAPVDVRGPAPTSPGTSGALAVESRTRPDIELAQPRASDDVVVVREVRHGVVIEAGLAVVILAITSALVVTPPSREVEAAAQTPQPQTVHLQARGKTVGYAVAVQPTLVGDNTIVATPRLLGKTGFLPTSLTGSVRAAAATATTQLRFTPLANGQWVAVAHFDHAGSWTITFTGTSPTATEQATLPVTIR